MKKFLIFIIGFVVGVLGTSIFYVSYEIAKGMQEWGKPKVAFDEEARDKIKDEFSISKSATDLYYYIDGFQDHTIFVAFSDQREQLDKIVTEKTGKRIEELTTWKSQDNHHSYIDQPGNYDKLYLTPLYDLNHVTDALFYQESTDTVSWHLIYDRQNNRLYYCWWNT